MIDQLQVFYEIAKELLKAGNPRVNQFTVFALEEAIAEVKRLRVDAQTGQQLAFAALKEAIGVEQDCAITPQDAELPVMGGTVTQEQVVELALARRPEVAQAAAGVDAFRLEVCAQDRVRRVPGGFELAGRWPGAAPRGCSLTIEEMLGGGSGSGAS